MKNTYLSDSFTFVEYSFGKYRYTDNRHGSPRHYLATMEEGRCRIVAEDVEIEACAGEAFYIPMGLSYQSYWYGEDNIRFRSYGFDHFPDPVDYRLQKLPDHAFGAIRSIPLGDVPDAAALGAMYTVLGSLLTAMEQADIPECDRLVRRAVEFMSRNIARSIDDVARHCCVSQSTLYAAFRAALGKTPNELRQQLLAQRAVKLLVTTALSVQQISDMLNFCSTDYFRRVLKKHTGKTPRQIRSDARLP